MAKPQKWSRRTQRQAGIAAESRFLASGPRLGDLLVLAVARRGGRATHLGNPDLVGGVEDALVVVSACARLVVNPEHTIEQTTGPFSIRQAIFNGWTLPELAVLHQYRKRAA